MSENKKCYTTETTNSCTGLFASAVQLLFVGGNVQAKPDSGKLFGHLQQAGLGTLLIDMGEDKEINDHHAKLIEKCTQTADDFGDSSEEFQKVMASACVELASHLLCRYGGVLGLQEIHRKSQRGVINDLCNLSGPSEEVQNIVDKLSELTEKFGKAAGIDAKVVRVDSPQEFAKMLESIFGNKDGETAATKAQVN